ncbi:probable polygalacturonase At1g80170 [Gossypium raimondii]|uniref:probable polygalacturonase At1g80170 n=1 Tax=Gossypium raimondii TaxID=29730 RepID=UPI00227BBEA3|nr:probable polygalacturonase At1g80170 [Gossypium raimondii]
MEPFVYDVNFAGGIGDGESDDTEIDGILIAPTDPSSWKCNDTNCNNWITFQHFDGLIVQGIGSLHGQGQKWWQMGCMHNNVGFAILDSKNVHISGLTSVDSRKWHISIERSSSVHASNLNIKAPEDSPNTDGIRIQHSTNVTISSSTIKTGDDCIGIGDGSKYININRILCGPGHGISIGSLGENGRRETVERANFCTTENGLRIKTWEDMDMQDI